jgi:aspartate ammonia-lyase
MRLEKDSLGEIQLNEEAYYGIGTARLLAAVGAVGPLLPKELAINLVRLRQSQAVTFGRNGAWSSQLAEAIQNAAEKIATGEVDVADQLKAGMLHGGGARGLVVNVDEVLANVALALQQRPKGEYHLLAPLFQLDSGFAHQNAFVTALNVSLVQEIDELLAALDQCLVVLQQQATRFQEQKTLASIHFQAVKIAEIGAEFACCAESVSRVTRLLAWYRADLLRIWCDAPDVVAKLQELVGVEVFLAEGRAAFPLSTDLYSGVSALFKTAAMSLLQLCNGLRLLVGMSQELEAPKRWTSPVFNPAAREMLIPDTVSQIAFQLVGSDACITAAINAGPNGLAGYLPLISTHLLDSARLLKSALGLLSQNFLTELSVNATISEQAIDETPLQAEKLIPLLGYDRAVQVARIAALTGKPVRMVVVRMKLLTEQQAEALFLSHVSSGEADMMENER